MLRKLVAVCTILMLLFVWGCAAHNHQVGSGASTGQTDSARQWYALFGLIPLGSVDSKAMAGGASDYDVHTEQGFVDIILNAFTGMVTIQSRTVTVTK